MIPIAYLYCYRRYVRAIWMGLFMFNNPNAHFCGSSRGIPYCYLRKVDPEATTTKSGLILGNKEEDTGTGPTTGEVKPCSKDCCAVICVVRVTAGQCKAKQRRSIFSSNAYHNWAYGVLLRVIVFCPCMFCVFFCRFWAIRTARDAGLKSHLPSSPTSTNGH